MVQVQHVFLRCIVGKVLDGVPSEMAMECNVSICIDEASTMTLKQILVAKHNEGISVSNHIHNYYEAKYYLPTSPTDFIEIFSLDATMLLHSRNPMHSGLNYRGATARS